MEGREKPHVVKYKAITNDWNHDASCTLVSLPVWYLLYRAYQPNYQHCSLWYFLIVAMRRDYISVELDL
jgi:hypothetical protein